VIPVVVNAQVFVGRDGSLYEAARQLKKRLQKEGYTDEIFKRRLAKPSERLAQKRSRARKIRLKRARKRRKERA
jgi:ribosomal protein S21